MHLIQSGVCDGSSTGCFSGRVEEIVGQVAVGVTYSRSFLSFKGHSKPEGLCSFQNSVAL